MIIETSSVDVTAGPHAIRCLVCRPKAPGPWSGVLAYSDIFQLTGPMVRVCQRLAGHGFVVVAPEIYARIEPPGLAIPFDDAGRQRGLADAQQTPVAHFDEDRGHVLDALARLPGVDPQRLGAVGFCIGGHLAFRAALDARVKAAVCCYGTGLHTGKLGRDDDAGSLARAGEVAAELLLVWGEQDPHIPFPARAQIHQALHEARVRFRVRTWDAEHAFMRDEGPRYDAAATDAAFTGMVDHLREVLR